MMIVIILAILITVTYKREKKEKESWTAASKSSRNMKKYISSNPWNENIPAYQYMLKLQKQYNRRNSKNGLACVITFDYSTMTYSLIPVIK